MRNLYVFILVVFLGPVLAFSQEQVRDSYSMHKSNNHQSNGLFSSTPDLGLELGSSFSTGFGGSLFTQSIAPNLRFSNNQNFSLILGSVISTSNTGSMMSGVGPNVSAMPDRFMSTTIYALGAYSVNPRFTITGGTWVERNNFNMMQNQMNPQAFDLNARGMMLGMDYKITENLRFGAEISVSNGYNPFSPMNYNRNSLFHNPNPFHRRSPW